MGKEKTFELKGHNSPWCAPWQTRQDGGYYKPRGGQQPLLQGLPAELITWLVQHSKTPAPKQESVEWEFHEDFELADFLEHNKSTEDKSYTEDGSLWVVVEECPLCGKSSGNSTGKAGRCKFIFSGKGYGFVCHACGISGREEFEEAMAANDPDWEPWDGVIYADIPLESKPGFEFEDPKEETTPEPKADVAAETCADVRKKIDDMMHVSGEEINAREKERFVCQMIYEHMMANGKLYNCGNVATYLDTKTREIIQIIKGSSHFQRLLVRYGVFPADRLTLAIGLFLGSMATTAKENTVYAMSYYDGEQHLLYVNEYAGNFLRIDGAGKITRLRNGDDDMLFSDGKEAQCDPLVANLELAQLYILCNPLEPDAGIESGLLRREILDTIIYAEDGVGREHATTILLTAILALFFQERIPSNPFMYFFGAGASMKTSLASKVGKLIQGRKFKVRPATDDEKALKDMALSLPFLVLDEANNIKKLMNVLKVIATGGMDTRRELYTTASVRHTPYQARIWMTANTASLTNETISARMMIIDAGSRTEENPYRSEHYLEWPEEVRNDIWTELVGRLAATMRDLADADRKGEGDLSVSHRMSSFFVFGLTLAKQRRREAEFQAAMDAMAERQMGASAEDCEIVHLIQQLPSSYNAVTKGGKTTGMHTADEWAQILVQVVPEANVELKRKVARPGWVRYMFQANVKVLKKECGLVVGSYITKTKNKIKTYGFTKCAGSPARIEVDAADEL